MIKQELQKDNNLVKEKSIKGHKKKKSKLRETFETIIIAFLLAIFIRATIAEARYIPSESMLPTLEIGDRLIIEKISNHFGIPNRGDIIVFYPPNRTELNTDLFTSIVRWLGFTSDVAYIKRVIGLPGEKLSVENGTIFINGEPLEEPYINEKPFYEYPVITVPKDSIFMMGDNRNNSLDSHVWGPLPIKNIIGKAVFRFWPPNRIGLTVK